MTPKGIEWRLKIDPAEIPETDPVDCRDRKAVSCTHEQ